MTADDLDLALDSMRAAALETNQPDGVPGLITVESGLWVGGLSRLAVTCASLADGMRHRNIQIHVASTLETRILSRAEAGDRGAPYRDLSPRAAAGDAAA